MYRHLPSFLKEMREQANLTQRELGKLINKPHSYIYNCETANRRVDITEFILWSEACGKDPIKSLARLIKLIKE
jgi:transcriptional regulator with XRE-family HTH domain